MSPYTTSDNLLIVWQFDPACTLSQLEESSALAFAKSQTVRHFECIAVGAQQQSLPLVPKHDAIK